MNIWFRRSVCSPGRTRKSTRIMSYTSRWSFKKLLLWWLLRSTGSFPRQIRLAEKGQARSQIGREERNTSQPSSCVHNVVDLLCVWHTELESFLSCSSRPGAAVRVERSDDEEAVCNQSPWAGRRWWKGHFPFNNFRRSADNTEAFPMTSVCLPLVFGY